MKYGTCARGSHPRVREVERSPSGPTTWLCLQWLDEVLGERRRNSPGWTRSTRQRIPRPEARSLRQKSPEQGLHDVQTVCVWSAARRCARCARLSQGVMQRAMTTVLRLAALHVPSLALPSWREILAWLFWLLRDLSEPVSAGCARRASPAWRSCSHWRPNSPSSPDAPAP